MRPFRAYRNVRHAFQMRPTPLQGVLRASGDQLITTSSGRYCEQRMHGQSERREHLCRIGIGLGCHAAGHPM